jgi:hypothetical protein
MLSSDGSGDAVDDEEVHTTDRADGWGVLVKAGCVMDDLCSASTGTNTSGSARRGGVLGLLEK